MSTKKRYILEANLISEQRYLTNKFLMETEDPTQPAVTTPQPVTTIPKPVTQTTDLLTKDYLEKSGINTTDAQTHQSIITQLEPYSNKVNVSLLKPHVGKDSFFDELHKHVNISHKFDKNSGAFSGEEVKLSLPGGIKLQGTIGVKDNQIQGLKDVGLQQKTKIGNVPVNYGIKYNNPTSGNFDLSNVRASANITIPNKKKHHGPML